MTHIIAVFTLAAGYGLGIIVLIDLCAYFDPYARF
jgi:hypothetical protein